MTLVVGNNLHSSASLNTIHVISRTIHMPHYNPAVHQQLTQRKNKSCRGLNST